VQQVTKTVMSPSTAVSQSTSSGAMTGVCVCVFYALFFVIKLSF
jgi:hypothetical protein